ncbi:MAG: hypothetical protein JSV82_01695 [Planctomycetota bacterium]|nr:MAG: hypothetical protein JSV82_01695 [Planctomycetota bacterium]
MWNLFERIINALKPPQQPDQPSQDSPRPPDHLEAWNQDAPEQQQAPEQTVAANQQDI